MVEDERAEGIKRRMRALLRMAGIIALTALGLMIIVFAICWFAGWRSASQIRSGLSRAGASVILLGLLSIIGGWGQLRDSEFAQSVFVSKHLDTDQATLKDSLRSFNLAIVVIAAGLLCIGVAALI